MAALALAAGGGACGGGPEGSMPVQDEQGVQPVQSVDPLGIGPGNAADGTTDDQGGSVPGSGPPRTSIGVG